MDTFRHPVATHVEVVLDDMRFKASARLRRLMRYLADRTVSGEPPPSQQEIATQVLGLAEDFDCVADSRVRVEVLRLRKALETYNQVLPFDAPRLTVPLAEYALRIAAPPAPALRSPVTETGIPILIAVNHPREQETDEQLVFCVSEALQFCETSPLVGSTRLNLHLVDIASGSDPADEARRIGAQAVLSLRARGRGAAFSLCATATAMPFNRVLGSMHAGADCTVRTADEATTNAARQLAALIADPFSGVARKLDARTLSQDSFGASQMAYAYMRTQRIGRARQASDRLVDVHSRSAADATTLALLSDMHRVLAVAEQHGPPSYMRALDLAEQAVLLDPDNAAARLSLGYARLASGDLSGAARSAGQLARARLFGSTLDDTRLLSILASHDLPDGLKDPMSGSQTFIGLVSAVIHHLDRNELSAAAEALEDAHHDSIFWIQLFRMLVMQTLGELPLARRSAKQLNALNPDFRTNGENIIRAFFGRRTLGMKLETSYREVFMSDKARSAKSLGFPRV